MKPKKVNALKLSAVQKTAKSDKHTKCPTNANSTPSWPGNFRW